MRLKARPHYFIVLKVSNSRTVKSPHRKPHDFAAVAMAGSILLRPLPTVILTGYRAFSFSIFTALYTTQRFDILTKVE